MNKATIAGLALLILASCGTKQTAVTTGSTSTTAPVSQQDESTRIAREKLAFVQKVSDGALYQQNVVSKLSFTLNSGSKNITVPGSIHMRKDDVIRIQLFVPLLGTEVGRLEFTKDYVLILDRIHKQYIKGDYNQVSFLRDRGINFYSLQALFWNQLFLPGAQKVSEAQLSQYDVDLQTGLVELLQQKMSYKWTATKTDGHITAAQVAYLGGGRDAAELNWKYDSFRSFGSKQFPHLQVLNFKMDKKDVTVTLDMNGVSADSNWDTRTTVSDRYKAVKVEDVLKQLMSL